MLTPLLVLALLSAVSPQDAGRTPEYPALVLQHVLTGEKDEVRAAVVHVLIDGRVQIAGEVVYDPGAETASGHDPWAGVQQAIGALVEPMDTEPVEGVPIELEVRTGRLLIRADINSPFAVSLKLLELCVANHVVKIDFAVGDVRNAELDPATGLVPQTVAQQRIPIDLPIGVTGPEEAQRTPMSLRVLDAGDKLDIQRAEKKPWDGEPGTRFRLDLATRRVEYIVGPAKSVGYKEFRSKLQGMANAIKGRTLVVTAHAGVTTGEVLVAIDAARSLGVADVRFVAPE